jgi:hypothetical protein
MADQKYCRNCGAPNPPEAKFCANCSKEFVSAASAAPPSAASAAAVPWEQLPQSDPSPEPTIFGISRKFVVIGIIALFVLLTLGCVAIAMTSPSTPTPTVQATVAPTATVKATATPVPTATPKPTAKPTATPEASVTASNELRLSLFTTLMEGKGYKSVTPFTKTTENGKTVYKGAMQDTSSGITFDMTLYPTDTLSNAVTLQNQKISSYKAMGYVGDFSDEEPDLWVGVLGAHTGVGILTFDTSVLNTPAVLVYTGTA